MKEQHHDPLCAGVSMESGLEDRNNLRPAIPHRPRGHVSMESGLEDRNNILHPWMPGSACTVSMESGLEDRNNYRPPRGRPRRHPCLNGVRPRRPEQCGDWEAVEAYQIAVSMESGLEDRNNLQIIWVCQCRQTRLNGVRPRRPEQCAAQGLQGDAPSASQWSPA